MWFFIARRLLYAVPILLGVSFVVFCLMKLVPGDAADVMIPPEAPKEVADMIRARFGLDQPIHIQYLRWLQAIASGDLPTDFGFPIAVHAHEPETIYVVPITSDSHHFPPDGKLRVYRSRSGGNAWEALTDGLPQEHCYVNVLRDALAVDSLAECGIYFGTTGGQVYGSVDSGDHWAPIVRDLPAVLSVEAQTLS